MSTVTLVMLESLEEQAFFSKFTAPVHSGLEDNFVHCEVLLGVWF